SQSFIDEVIEMQVANLPADLAGRVHAIMHHIKNILLLRKHHFDIGIVLSPGQLVKSAAYMFLTGIPMRIGNSYPLRSNRRSKLFLTHAVDELENIHDIEQNIRLLEPLGLGSTNAPYYSLQIPEQNIQEAEAMLSSTSYKLKAKSSLIGIHAGCAVGFEWKRWPLEHFADVAKTLAQKDPNIRILLFGGKDETADKQEMLRMINKDGEIAYDISASLLTTAAIMKKCSFFLANDSGLMHIAAAVGIPTLGLFGPTSEVLTGPRGNKSTVLRADGTIPVYNTEKGNNLGNTSHESLLKISVQMVLDKTKL
ncbi:MAG: glycosyltransferase family 9 protein, partial [bacterium]|nr:glycosyltransferase family 9 protein [bacterium]